MDWNQFLQERYPFAAYLEHLSDWTSLFTLIVLFEHAIINVMPWTYDVFLRVYFISCRISDVALVILNCTCPSKLLCWIATLDSGLLHWIGLFWQ